MADHSIRFCTHNDVDSLIDFIGVHWKRDHIFTRNRELFDFQHRIDEENYSFVCAWQGNEIIACLGFTAIEQYVPVEKRLTVEGKHPFYGKGIWLCLWKSREEIVPGMGFYLYRFLEESLEPDWVSAIGYSPFSEKVFKMLRWERTLMRHYIRMNPGIAPGDLTLATLLEPNISPGNDAAPCELKRVEWQELHPINTGLSVPAKNADYLTGRYEKHPHYRYKLLSLDNGSETALYLVARMVQVPEGKCLRIIDAYGDISQAFSLHNPDAFFELFPGIQYVDFLCEGINPDLLAGLGLREKTENEIVPEYFAPFKPENIMVKAAVSKPVPGFHYCKGDADQDRPN